MRSIQLVAPGVLEEHEMPQPPDPGPGEVLVKLRAVGICGSDLHWYREGRIGAFAAVYPQVLGHEPAGEVIALGSGVKDVAPGDSVAIEPTVSCGHCEYCLAGRHNNCSQGRFMGSPQLPGLLREYAVVPVENVTKYPSEFGWVKATLIEPLAVMMHMLELVDIHLGDSVAIAGAGPIGLLAGSVARSAGASKLIIADRVPHRIDMARKIGAGTAVEMDRFVSAVLDETGGRGVDLAVDAAGSQETIRAALTVTRPGGTVLLIGLPSESTIGFDMAAVMGKELRVQALKRSNHRALPAIALLHSQAISTDLITHRVPLEQAPAAFDMLSNYRDGVGKLVVELPA